MNPLASRVVQLELSSSVEGGLQASVFPQLHDDISQLGRHCSFFNGVRQILQLLCILLWFSCTQKDPLAPAQYFWLLHCTILCQWKWNICKLIRCTSCVVWDLWSCRAKIDGQHLHASDDGQNRLQDVAVDDRSELQLFLFCITTLMENPATWMTVCRTRGQHL